MRILRVDLISKKVVPEPLPRPVRFPLGGRAVIDFLLLQFCPPSIHPLSPENLLVIAPGLLSGTAAPSSGRLSIGGKSPLTGGIKEANVGGVAGHKLARLGIAALAVEGRSEGWTLLRVDRNEVSFEPAADILGLGNYEACERLKQRYGAHVGILLIGRAGERRYASSTVAATDTCLRPSRHAARGGVGAVMGSKLLKAIVIDDEGTSLRKAEDPQGFSKAVKEMVDAIKTGPHGTSGDFLRTYGTAGVLDIDNAKGSLPTMNYRMGSFEGHDKINGQKLVELQKKRLGSTGHACMPGCVVHCSNIYKDESGNYLTSGLEYETLAMLGSNLGIDDIDAIARMDRRCDEIGIDTIETGATIGILSEVGLFNFGDYRTAEALIEEIANDTPLGRILASGVETAAKVFGIERVPAVKGQAIPAHEPRALKGWGVTYATSPQGADHTTGPVVEDPLSPSGQVERSRRSQIVNTALDATGLCHFTFLYRYPEIVVSTVNALLGLDLTFQDFFELGRQMLLWEREFNLKAGIGPARDKIPDFMRREPLPPNNTVFDVPEGEIQRFFDLL